MNMILKRVDFNPLYKEVDALFEGSLLHRKLGNVRKELRDSVRKLATANFICYQGNMGVIEARRMKVKDPKVYSDFDWRVRTYGEQRVHAKIAINAIVSAAFPAKRAKKAGALSDDIVYSIGDMIDRLTIEWIKASDFTTRMKKAKTAEEKEKLAFKLSWTKEWSRRVKIYLKKKLGDVHKKGYYESVAETRTYNLSGIGKGK